MSSFAQAQALISRNLVNGRMVELFDDFTWRYEDEIENFCVQLSSVAEICDFEPEWKLIPVTSPNLFIDFYFDELNQARISTHNFGDDIGYTLENVIEFFPTNIAEYNGITEDEINIFAEMEATVSDLPARTVVYGMNLNGVNMFIYSTVWLGDSHLMQILTQNYDLNITKAGVERHIDFVSKVRIQPQN